MPEKISELIVSCGKCRAYAAVRYMETVEQIESSWICPSCRAANPVRLCGRVVTATTFARDTGSADA